MTGHADGMVRFVSENKVVGNDSRKGGDNCLEKRVKDELAKHGIGYVDLPYFSSIKVAKFCSYVNYLETENLIVMQRYGVHGNKDYEAKQIMQGLFPNKKIETTCINKIWKQGGGLNCISWEI
jgi:agmatine deiminase